MSVISTRFFDNLKHKPKILQCSRTLKGAEGEALIPKGGCFLQVKVGKQNLRDGVIMINNLNCNYIIGTAVQRLYCVATGFSVKGRHFLSLNGQMFVQTSPHPQ